jgi:L-threonylcarbamoyladenylate synthase
MKQANPEWKSEAIELVRILKAGGIALTSTDTVWGVGCDATNEEAVARMAALKGRPEEKSFIALVGDEGTLSRLLPHLPEAAWELLAATDRPVTLVGEAGPADSLAPGLVHRDGTLAVRWVQDPYLQFILRGLNRPLASSSANLSGVAFSGRYADIDSRLLEHADAVATYRRDSPVGRPSWVVKFDAAGRFSVLRS